MYSRRRLDQAQKMNISFQNFSTPREAISFMYSGIGISDNFSWSFSLAWLDSSDEELSPDSVNFSSAFTQLGFWKILNENMVFRSIVSK